METIPSPPASRRRALASMAYWRKSKPAAFVCDVCLPGIGPARKLATASRADAGRSAIPLHARACVGVTT
jgi:hypothetical protein